MIPSTDGTVLAHSEQSPLLVSNNNSSNIHHRSNRSIVVHLSISDEFHNDSNFGCTHTTTTATIPATRGGGTSTVRDTVLNLMKTCMGTGCLALPYACHNSGIVLYCIGLLIIATWNMYSVWLLNECLQYIPSLSSSVFEHQHEKYSGDNSDLTNGNLCNNNTEKTTLKPSLPPPDGTNTLGKVAWYAFGTKGLYGIDTCQIILLIGIIVSYISAIISFLDDIIVSLFDHVEDKDNNSSHHNDVKVVSAIITFILLGCICLWLPDLSALAKASASGLFVLFISFLVIAAYGMYLRYYDGDNGMFDSTTLIKVDGYHQYHNDSNYNTTIVSTTTNSIAIGTTTQATTNNTLQYWPQSIGGITDWYGIAVFGYGIVPLTYNFQESMIEPEKIVSASSISLLGVAIVYIMIGVTLYILFPSIHDDILHVLPTTIWIIPFCLRIFMIIIVFITAPLIAIPCSEILEGKLFGNNTNDNANSKSTINILHRRIIVRFTLIGFCTVLAVSLPGFVQVLSLVGCFCVAIIGFCVPPLLHLRFIYISSLATLSHDNNNNNNDDYSTRITNNNNKNQHPSHKQQQQQRHEQLVINNINSTSNRSNEVIYDNTMKERSLPEMSWCSSQLSKVSSLTYYCCGHPLKNSILRDTALLLLGIVATILSTISTLRQIHS